MDVRKTGGEQPPVPHGLAGLARQLEEMRQAVEQLQGVVGAICNMVCHPPIHLDVERLEVERLEFHVDRIDVNELSGELNLGLTQMFKASGGGQQQQEGGAGSTLPQSVVSRWRQLGAPSGPQRHANATRQLWPPPSEEVAEGR